jgi:hypothetical protein
MAQREIKQHLELLAVMSGKKSVEDCKALGKKPRKHTQHEAKEQEAVFDWARLQECVYPELKWLYHIPNGGSRNKIEAANLKNQGVKSGVLDLHLPVARHGYHSLYIEMKSKDGKVSENQDKWIKGLREEGNKVEVCYGTESAINALKQYLQGGT